MRWIEGRKSPKARRLARSVALGVESLENRLLLAATKIMPLGDSITSSAGGHASYRYWLWNTLTSAGYNNIDFVGSQSGVYNGTPLYQNFDQNHEGHWGWRADEILGQIAGWANTHRPDVVLMHLGTNDLTQNQTVNSTITDLGSIIDTIRQYSPNVTVLLAQIIPDNLTPSTIQQLNAQIPTLASQKNTANSKVIAVDQWTGFSVSADTWDGVHPDESGEQKMSSKWYSGLTGVLPAPIPPGNNPYVSDLAPYYVSNGWGPYERDMSNGEQAQGDGLPIKLNGTTYSKGLGIHAGSELRYTLGGNYDTFTASIGVDDEVGTQGSVVFQVWADGTKLYDSGTMTGSTATKNISVTVTGKNDLRLIVTDAGSNYADHADWANARLNKNAGPGAPVVSAGPGGTLTEGSTFSSSGSFTDSGAGPWTATVNYGDGSGT
ncbi:MAG: NPCBM/NEW2 domain-containing protein, partial [Tepidisphaeraceae bacterium]